MNATSYGHINKHFPLLSSHSNKLLMLRANRAQKWKHWFPLYKPGLYEIIKMKTPPNKRIHTHGANKNSFIVGYYQHFKCCQNRTFEVGSDANAKGHEQCLYNPNVISISRLIKCMPCRYRHFFTGNNDLFIWICHTIRMTIALSHKSIDCHVNSVLIIICQFTQFQFSSFSRSISFSHSSCHFPLHCISVRTEYPVKR